MEYKRKFSLLEMYRAFVFIPKAIAILKKNKKSNLVDQHFIERLHLVVTEVNGCPVCSYAHTKMALKQGMSNEEISSFLSGGDQFIQPEEAKAIFFAQHFADARGIPKAYAYDALVKEYGAKKAEIILSAMQVMIVGNMYGLPLSAFKSRLNGKAYKDSSLVYEFIMIIVGIFLFPVAIIHGIIRSLLGFPNQRFDTNDSD